MKNDSVDVPAKSYWIPFEWFVLRATGMPAKWVSAEGQSPVWELTKSAYSNALDAARKQLFDYTERPEVREALFLSNPGLYEHIESYVQSLLSERRSRKHRRREAALYRYLQRFCAKNDTTSFFGATSLGRFDVVRQSEVLDLPVADVRRVHLEHWLLARFLSEARESLVQSGHWEERWVHQGAVASELATRDGEEPRLSQAVCPVGDVDAIGYIRKVLQAQPESPEREAWLSRLEDLVTGAKAFEVGNFEVRREVFAQLESQVTDWLGMPARRGAGEFYASRTILHEVGDRSGEVVALTEDERQLVHQSMQGVMELSAHAACIERMKFAAWYDHRFGRKSQAFSDVGVQLSADTVNYHLQAPAEAKALYGALMSLKASLRRNIDAHLATHGPTVPHRLDNVLLEKHLSRFKGELDATGVAYTNPDLLLGWSGASNELSVVIGDVHAMPFLTPAAYAAAPDEARCWSDTAQFLSDLAKPAKPALPVYQRRSFVGYEPDFGVIALEVDGLASAPIDRRADMSALQITRSDRGFEFEVSTYDGTSHLVMPLTRSANLASRYTQNIARSAWVYPLRMLDWGEWLSGPDWRDVTELPRLCWGNVVVHRRHVVLPVADWACEYAPHRAFRRLAKEGPEGLPMVGFFKAAGQPKPIMVDWRDPISAEFAYRVARRSGDLIVVEMLPALDKLWLHGPEGMHTSELRTVFVRS